MRRWNIALGVWPDLQGAVGWMVAMFAFLGVWSTVSQVVDGWRGRAGAGK
jgi:hypothetical protein